jgi:hypothetical protein
MCIDFVFGGISVIEGYLANVKYFPADVGYGLLKNKLWPTSRDLHVIQSLK